jgi:DnaJ-class molecular chaperone
MKMCDYCGGQGEWESSLSPITGEVFHTNCWKCRGTGWIPDDAGPEGAVSSEERRKLTDRQVRDHIEFGIKSAIASGARTLFPGAFRR